GESGAVADANAAGRIDDLEPLGGLDVDAAVRLDAGQDQTAIHFGDSGRDQLGSAVAEAGGGDVDVRRGDVDRRGADRAVEAGIADGVDEDAAARRQI